MSDDTLILTRRDVARLLPLADCIEAVEDAFRQFALGQTLGAGVLGLRAPAGGFHIKAAGLSRGRRYFAAKINGNFGDNPARFGLPRIQGVVVLCDADDGSPLAIMDSSEITALRTAAATAVAARYLARAQARVVTIVGCGVQGRAQLRALALVRPVAEVWAADQSPAEAERFSAEMMLELGCAVRVTLDLRAALAVSDICVTCTSATAPLFAARDVAPGTFLAAVGADSESKQEMDPELLATGKVVCDTLEQAAQIGDLHHALAAGRMTRAQVHAELGQVVAAQRPGRESESEVIIFDSTGTALEDVAAAALVYEAALRLGQGLRVALLA